MSSNLMQAEQSSTLPQVLILGAVDGIGYGPSFTYEAQVVTTLSAAARSLATRRFDIVLSQISAEYDEGLALPSLLLELKQQCILSSLPAIIWYGAQEHGWLEWHVRLAERKGVRALFFSSSSANIDLNIASALVESAANGDVSQYTERHTPNAYDLMRALISDNGFRVVLQPQVNLQTGEIVGAEALARWSHASKGNIAPSTFVPLARKAGLEQLLFHTVMARVIALLSDLQRLDIAVPIAVNASAETLCIPGISRWLGQRLRDAAVPNSLLTIELTEDVPVRDWLALSMELGCLRMRGFPIAMDDFGCGSASIDLLTQMPFSTLKIDGRFVKGMAHDSGCRAAVSAAISIGQSMELNIVAEGVESSWQINALLERGCRIGQGFALSVPLEVDEFMRLLAIGNLYSIATTAS
ncbi:EAL domain-containing protein [Pseudomonas chlororaphis]|uniref:EAL domain-containing protein n=1 Tax=Pseudomonas chlororaphis TaxID=587753 RepID=UPI001E545132|nr:EAL domain-containing protein [Pseudomonas chlororaphis]MCB2254981.1 EAL domain-containing protein [Pseudomonas chlororaphis]